MSVLAECLSLPRSAAEWIVNTVDDEATDPLSLWVEADELRGFTVGTPGLDEYAELLHSVLMHPSQGEPSRPASVTVASAEEQRALEPLLSPLEIPVHVKLPTPEQRAYFDDVRPAVVQQLMLGATLPDEVPHEQFTSLLDAIAELEDADPWTVLPDQGCFMVAGLGPQPMAVLLGREDDVKALGVVILEQGHMPDAELDGLWLQFVPDTILGHTQTWAHVGYADDRLLDTPEQLDMLLTGIEVVVKSVAGKKRPPAEAAFMVEDWVTVPRPVEVVFIGEEPKPASKSKAKHKSRRHRK